MRAKCKIVSCWQPNSLTHCNEFEKAVCEVVDCAKDKSLAPLKITWLGGPDFIYAIVEWVEDYPQ